jgi:hypothetical protein
MQHIIKTHATQKEQTITLGDTLAHTMEPLAGTTENEAQ